MEKRGKPQKYALWDPCHYFMLQSELHATHVAGSKQIGMGGGEEVIKGGEAGAVGGERAR